MAESGTELEVMREVAWQASGLLGWLDNAARRNSTVTEPTP